MEGISIIIPVFNKIESTMRCIHSIRELNKNSTFEIIIVDNGSTDETPQFFSSQPFNPTFSKEEKCGNPPLKKGDIGGFSNEKKITYIRNEENLGVSRACNQGAGAANCGIFCFMHNDVFIFQENWTASLSDLITKASNAGMIGLYGAKTLRKDASFRGKTIVHSIKGSPSMNKQVERVAVVDGLLMATQKLVFKKIGGFSEDFPVHYYDKDISLKAMKNGLHNYVMHIPFEHICATTRKGIKEDDRIRDEAHEKFLAKWKHFLPVDVSSWREKIGYTVKRKKDN